MTDIFEVAMGSARRRRYQFRTKLGTTFTARFERLDADANDAGGIIISGPSIVLPDKRSDGTFRLPLTKLDSMVAVEGIYDYSVSLEFWITAPDAYTAAINYLDDMKDVINGIMPGTKVRVREVSTGTEVDIEVDTIISTE